MRYRSYVLHMTQPTQPLILDLVTKSMSSYKAGKVRDYTVLFILHHDKTNRKFDAALKLENLQIVFSISIVQDSEP